jgi:hypothetical protein
MMDLDPSNLKGCADEENWNKFVLQRNGELIKPVTNQKGSETADYFFRGENVIIELKIIETEFLHENTMKKRVQKAFDEYPDIDPGDHSKPLRRELLNIFRNPLQRIFKKANSQIKSTKKHTERQDSLGIVIFINDRFKAPPPGLVIDLLDELLQGPSYGSVDAFVYVTNHYVEIYGSEYAHLLWTARYNKTAPERLVEFIDELGTDWHNYCEKVIGPFDISCKVPNRDLDISTARVVSTPFRRYRKP